MLIQAYSTRRDSCPHSFSAVDERTRRTESTETDVELDAHLSALIRHAKHQTDADTTALQRHLRDVQRYYAFDIADITNRVQLAELTRWCEDANAVLVVDGALLDGQGRPLLAGAHGAPTGQVPMLAEATTRAAEVRRWLSDVKQVLVPDTVPPARVASELQAQTPEQVGLRVVSLVIVSDFAASLITGRPIEPAAMQRVCPRGYANLSPDELALFERRDQSDARRLQPRIEAANELLWALGRIEIGWPNQGCPVDEVKRIVLAAGEEAFLQELALRGENELAEEHECLASLVWALDDGAAYGGAVADVDPHITVQRLAAINWLRDSNVAWDASEMHNRG